MARYAFVMTRVNPLNGKRLLFCEAATAVFWKISGFTFVSSIARSKRLIQLFTYLTRLLTHLPCTELVLKTLVVKRIGVMCLRQAFEWFVS